MTARVDGIQQRALGAQALASALRARFRMFDVEGHELALSAVKVGDTVRVDWLPVPGLAAGELVEATVTATSPHLALVAIVKAPRGARVAGGT
jgi:hypothetical protein